MAMPESDSPNAAATTNQNGMDLTFLGSASFWSNIAVVTLGVLAAIAAAFALYFSSRLGAAKDAELDRFQAESKVAIAAADARAAEANENAAGATATAASANERAGILELEAAQQRERAATAERQLLELRQRIEPRVIGRINGTRLINALRSAQPKGLVDITCVLGDGEGVTFATQLDQILTAGGWTTSGVSQAVYTGGNPTGWGIFVQSLANVPPTATSLQRAFAAAGFPLQILGKAELAAGAIQMLVGNKQ